MSAAIGLYLASLIAAAPYVDTKGRFQVELPEGWRLLPAYGDSFGMRFQREIPGGRVSVTVHVDPVEVEGLEAFVREIEGWVLEQGLARRSRARGELGAHSAVVLGFEPVEKDKREQTAARSYFLEVRGHYYHLHVSASPAFVMKRAQREIDALISSFTPGSGPGPAARSPPGPAPAAPTRPIEGAWTSDAGVLVRFEPNGQFVMGAASGRYVLRGETLALMIDGKAPQSFRVELAGSELRLHSERLPAPAVYRRGPSAGAGSSALVGRWRAAIPGGTLELALLDSGRFALDARSGRWVHRDGLLSLTTDQGEVVAYGVEIEGERLSLSGGDLEEPLWLHKISPR